MATVTEAKSIPLAIREAVARGDGYRQHLKELQKQYDAAAAAREAAHSKLASSGIGPVSSQEIETLQKSRWAILASNEAGLGKMLEEAQSVLDNRNEEYATAQSLIKQFFDDGVARLVRDYGLRKSDAEQRMDSDPELVALKRIAHQMTQQQVAAKHTVQAIESSIQAIAETKSRLSRQWRSL